jgi:LPXTG-motif cell wall-anchored protein
LAAIIVPVVVGVLLLMAIAGFLFMKRRNPGWKLGSMFGMGKGDGYGSRKSRGERAVGTGNTGLGGMQMGDLGISRPQDGRNVFREEIKRQEGSRL